MAEPFLSEIRIMSFGFAPEGLGAVQRPVPADQPEPGAVLAARHDLRRRRAGQLRAARPARPRADPRRAAATRWASAAASRRTRCRIAEMPTHTHVAQRARTNAGDDRRPDRATHARADRRPTALYAAPTNLVAMDPTTIGNVGGSQAHLNMQPFLALNFCIALQGIFPSPDLKETQPWHNLMLARSACSPATSRPPAGCSARASCCRSPRTRRCSS